MAKWQAAFYKANEIEEAIEEIDDTVTIHVIPISDGKEFLLVTESVTEP